MTRKRWLIASSLAVTLTLFATACNGPTEETPAAEGCGTGEPIIVNLNAPAPPTNLDANYDTLLYSFQVTRNLFDGLFKFDDKMNVKPDLATDYEQTNDTTYVVSLRDDVEFHDGSAFTAEDVVNTFNRIATDKDLASKQASYISNVADVTATDEHEVTFSLTQPDASFIKVLASIIFITPKAAIEEVGNADFGQAPVGTGPFRFSSFSGDTVVLDANCDYFGEKAIPSSVEFRFIAEPATQISSLQSGEIDIATDVTPDAAASLEGITGVEVQSIAGNLTRWIGFNTNEGPFADERVRLAVNYAVDKEAITEDLLGGFATPVGQLYASRVFGFSDGIEPYPYDPDKARQLLEDAGYEPGEIQVEFILWTPSQAAVQQAVSSYLGDVGFDVSTKSDPNFVSDTWLQGKMAPNQIWLNQNGNILQDADFLLGIQVDSTRRSPYFKNKEIDNQIAEARAEQDPDARQALYDELNMTLRDTAVGGYLYSEDYIFGVSDRVDWSPRPDGAIYLAGVNKTP